MSWSRSPSPNDDIWEMLGVEESGHGIQDQEDFDCAGIQILYQILKRSHLVYWRGFDRIATPATCPLPRRQHSIALITGGTSLSAIEATLAQVSPFLGASAAIAVLVRSHEGGLCLKIREKLEQMGFRIEAGVRCQQGFVLSAYRHGFGQMENAA